MSDKEKQTGNTKTIARANDTPLGSSPWPARDIGRDVYWVLHKDFFKVLIRPDYQGNIDKITRPRKKSGGKPKRIPKWKYFPVSGGL